MSNIYIYIYIYILISEIQDKINFGYMGKLYGKT